MNDDKKDITRLEDISAFLHDEEPEKEVIETEETAEEEEIEEIEEIESSDIFSVAAEEPTEEETPEIKESEENELFSISEKELQPEKTIQFDTIPPEEEAELPDNNYEEEQTLVTPMEGSIEEEKEKEKEEEEEEEKTAERPEALDELEYFGNNTVMPDATSVANPPFSIILFNIKYSEDSQEILSILRESKILTDDNQSLMEQGLQHGKLLISHLSEYIAIHLVHKFRRFDLDIHMGLADEIRPPTNYDLNKKGPTSKRGLYQNRSNFSNLPNEYTLDSTNIIMSTTPALEGYQIQQYLGVISEHKIIDKELLETAEPPDKYGATLEKIYAQLAEALKIHAMKLKGNSIVGINYQITPLIDLKYKITCTGSVVWAE